MLANMVKFENRQYKKPASLPYVNIGQAERYKTVAY